MKMPSKGTRITVDGYGTGIFAGAASLDEPAEASILLKFEGTWQGHDLNAGYGGGIVAVPLSEYQENRIHPEQHSTMPEVSTEKRDAVLSQRFES